MMVSSNESIARFVGLQLKELASRPYFSAICPAVDHWMGELQMPPGCSSIQMDDALRDPGAKTLFVEALTELGRALSEDQSQTKEQIQQVILLLTIGEHALEGVYRPLRQVQLGAPADEPASRVRG